MIVREQFKVESQARSFVDITDEVQQIAQSSKLSIGLCQVFCHHTSASLILCENADPAVLDDLNNYMTRLVPEGGDYIHSAEGSDDMPAHIRSVLTHSDISIPLNMGKCDLGTWQGIYLWEHRARSHRRTITVTIIGE